MHGRDDEYSDSSISDVISGVAIRVIAITLIVFVCYFVSHKCFQLGFTVFGAETVEEAPGTDKEVTVEDGETIDELAAQLSEDEVIPSELAFRVQARLYKLKLYPGTYKLNTSMSTKEAVKTFVMTEQEYNDSLSQSADTVTEDEEGFIGGGDEGADEADVPESGVAADSTDNAAGTDEETSQTTQD